MLNRLLSIVSGPIAGAALNILSPVASALFWSILKNMIRLAIERAEKKAKAYVESTPGAADDEVYAAYLQNREQIISSIDSLYSMAKGRFDGK